MDCQYECESESTRRYGKTNTVGAQVSGRPPSPDKRHHIVGASESDTCCGFGTTPHSATARKNRSTTAFPCRRFDSEMCSFGKCAWPCNKGEKTISYPGGQWAGGHREKPYRALAHRKVKRGAAKGFFEEWDAGYRLSWRGE